MTNTSWQCDCANSRFPKTPLINAPVNTFQCGTNNRSALIQPSDCCLNRTDVENLTMASQTCRVNQSLSKCQCGSKMNCACQTLDASKISYDSVYLNSTNSNCTCVDRPFNTLECRCCLFNIALPRPIIDKP